MPLFSGDLGDVPRRLDPQDRDSPRHEVLEHVAVVAGRLDDQAVRAQAASVDLLEGACSAWSSSAGETLEKYRYSRKSTSGLTVWSIWSKAHSGQKTRRSGNAGSGSCELGLGQQTIGQRSDPQVEDRDQ